MARKSPAKAVRRRVWQSMRIMRRFTVPDLSRTTGAGINNTAKFVRNLARHGYIAPTGDYRGGRPGEYKGWRLVRNIGPEPPKQCDRCRRALIDPCESPAQREDTK